MPRPTLAALLAAAALLAGCIHAETPERRAARREARRDACVATELLIRSHDRARSLGQFEGGGALGQVLAASATYAAAYDEYARARAAQLAYQDSASRAGRGADSARLAAEAGRRALPAAAPGSVEATARASYDRDFAGARANPDFPCNKPDEQEGEGS